MKITDRNRQAGPAPSLRFAHALLALAAATLLAAAPADAAKKPSWGACLDCHEDKSLTLTTAKGEELSLAIAADELVGTAHAGLECQACHSKIDLDSHPTGDVIPSIDQYRNASSRACLGCHKPEKLRARPQHAAVVFEDQQLMCVECHGAHKVRKVAAWQKDSAANDYCLICHSKAISIQRPDGATLALAIDPAKLKASVHPDHECVDCHSDFSKTAHPVAPIGDRNQRAVAAAKTCAQCHEEKLRQAEGSIHFSMLRAGSAAAPGCTGCHSAHEVAPKERYATLAGTPCQGCHAEIFKAYTGSMHGKARGGAEHSEAPMCSECHRAHDVQGTAQPEKVRAACLGCHKTAESIHATWLPNADLHLKAVSCAACHAPMAQRVVALRLVEQGTGRKLTEREVKDLIGGDVAAAINSGDTVESSLNLWKAVRQLESRRDAGAAKLNVVGQLEVAKGVDAHRLASKGGAVRDCESCHTKGSKMFDQVALSLSRDDGRPKRIDGQPAMLTDAASVVSVPGFYALGVTRIVALDWLLVLALAGGLGVVMLHLTFRIRAARAHKEG